MKKFVLLISLICFSFFSYSQCVNNNILYNVPATPPCPGSTNVGCIYGGEYVIVNVVSGNTYTFSTCGGALWDTQITLYDNSGGGPSLGYNDDGCGLQSTITWIANFTGQLRVLVDQYNCINNVNCASLTISCISSGPTDCIYYLNLFDSFGDGWGTSNVGISINGGAYTYYTVIGSTNIIPIGVNMGDIIVLIYNNSGLFQEDNSYTLTFGGLIFSSGNPPINGISYAGNVTCNPPPSPPEDCIGSITICNNQSFNNNTNNTGNVEDLSLISTGCLSTLERQGTWYNFTPSAGGTLGFTINPSSPLDDYDFAIWGPFPPGSIPGSICPPLNAPLRCSFAAPPGQTGLNYSATDFTEDPFGDKWVQYMNVTIGQVYLLYISNFSQSGLSFSLTWDFNNSGASLDCTILSVEMTTLETTAIEDFVSIDWSTSSESNNSHFVVERSFDGYSFDPIGSVESQGESNTTTSYKLIDTDPKLGINYYRIRSVDKFNESDVSNSTSVLFGLSIDNPIVVPNPTNGHSSLLMESRYDGLVTIEFFDSRGRIVKSMKSMVIDGSNRIELDLYELDPGSYILRISDQNGISSQTKLAKFLQ